MVFWILEIGKFSTFDIRVRQIIYYIRNILVAIIPATNGRMNALNPLERTLIRNALLSANATYLVDPQLMVLGILVLLVSSLNVLGDIRAAPPFSNHRQNGASRTVKYGYIYGTLL